jgi:tetratricopeptide (TPR) repeat protein
MHGTSYQTLLTDCPEPLELNRFLGKGVLSDSALLNCLNRVRAWVELAVEKAKGVDSWAELALSGSSFDCSPPLEIENVAANVKNDLRDIIFQLIEKLIILDQYKEALFFLEKVMVLYATDMRIVPLISGLRGLSLIMNDVPLAEIPPNVHAVLAHIALENDNQTQASLHLESINNDAVIEHCIMVPLTILLAHRGRRMEGKRISEMSSFSFNKSLAMPVGRILEYLAVMFNVENFNLARRVLEAIDVSRIKKPLELGIYMRHLVRFGMPHQALVVADRLTQEECGWSEVYFYQALAYKTLFRFDDAFNALDQDEWLNGKREQNILLRGQLLWETNQLKQAVSVLRDGLNHSSCKDMATQGAIRQLLAVVYRNLDQMEKALFEHKTSVELSPKTWRTYFDMAITLSAVGRWDEAIETADHGVSNGIDMNNMCVFLSESLRNAEAGGTLSYESAKQCFYHTDNMMVRWYPYQAWGALLSIKSFFVHGKKRGVEKAVAALRKMCGALDGSERDKACEALSCGRAMSDPDLAMVFARAAFPRLPCEGFEHRYLAACASINQ